MRTYTGEFVPHHVVVTVNDSLTSNIDGLRLYIVDGNYSNIVGLGLIKKLGIDIKKSSNQLNNKYSKIITHSRKL